MIGNKMQIKDPKYWQEQISECLKGKIKGEELERDACSFLIDNGFAYHDALGWLRIEEITEAGITAGTDYIPAEGYGKDRRIAPEFLAFIERVKVDDRKNSRKPVEMVTKMLSDGWKDV